MMIFKRLRGFFAPAEPPTLPPMDDAELPPLLPVEPVIARRELAPYSVRDVACPVCGVGEGESVKYVAERTTDSRYAFGPPLNPPRIWITPAHLVWTCTECGATRETLTKEAA